MTNGLSKDTALRGLWYGALPVAGAAGALWLWPSAGSGSGLYALEELAAKHGAYVGIGLFVLFALLARYWGPLLLGERPAEARAPRARERWLPVLAWMAGAALLALALRALVQVAEVTSSSMLPTLQRGDKLLLNKTAYRRQPPRRGDIIVFRRTIGGREMDLVKRVIGVPGDRVAVKGNLPVVNGKHLPFCHASRYVHLTLEARVDGKVMVEFLDGRAHLAAYSPIAPPFDQEYMVGPGEVFVLGDNRESSLDSRAWVEGVPLEDVIGRAERLLVGARPALDNLWRPLGTNFDLPGLDASSLRDGIDQCLRDGAKVVRADEP